MWNPKMKHMQGITFLGMIFLCILVVFGVLICVKIVPIYLNDNAIKTSMKEMAKDTELAHASKIQLREKFIKWLDVNSIKNVSPDSLFVENRKGKYWLITKYEVRVPMIANIDCVLSFDDEVMIGEGEG